MYCDKWCPVWYIPKTISSPIIGLQINNCQITVLSPVQEIRKSLAPTKNSVLKGQYDWLGYVGWAKMSVSDNIGTNAWTNHASYIVD
jgi:hypothetical protein